MQCLTVSIRGTGGGKGRLPTDQFLLLIEAVGSSEAAHGFFVSTKAMGMKGAHGFFL